MADLTDEKNLVLKISKGDRTAFRLFYDYYSQKVYRYSKYFIKHKETCEEIVSDVFMNIWHNKENLPSVENMESYLFIITRNKAYNYIDKESRIPEWVGEVPANIADSLNPEHLLLTKELEQTINASIAELPERCRIIFLMARNEKLKYHQIAKVLSISEKTVHAQMVTALKKLNASLKKYFYLLF
jgi:RNA polymerase sigma-70 factor (ECF subfamily)